MTYKIGESVALRAAFGPALVPIAERDDRIIVVTADLGGSVGIGPFREAFPDRYINCGVAEQSMIGIAAGLASEGYIPLAVTFGSFLGRAVDHIRQSIGHNRLKVNIVGSHGGISNGMDGPSAHAIEDVGIMRSMPTFAVVAPGCANQLESAVAASINYGLRDSGDVDPPVSVYLRLYREPSPVYTSPDETFEVGKAIVRKAGDDLTIISYGPHVGFCLEWLPSLPCSAELIEVHTIQPIDEEAILSSVKKTGAVVTVEDHFRRGGLASAVSEVLVSAGAKAHFRAVALNGYTRSGPYYELRDAVGLGQDALAQATKEVLENQH